MTAELASSQFHGGNKDIKNGQVAVGLQETYKETSHNHGQIAVKCTNHGLSTLSVF
jgi:hypothetical protein